MTPEKDAYIGIETASNQEFALVVDASTLPALLLALNKSREYLTLSKSDSRPLQALRVCLKTLSLDTKSSRHKSD